MQFEIFALHYCHLLFFFFNFTNLNDIFLGFFSPSSFSFFFSNVVVVVVDDAITYFIPWKIPTLRWFSNCPPYNFFQLGYNWWRAKYTRRIGELIKTMQHLRNQQSVALESWSCHFLLSLWILWTFFVRLSTWVIINNVFVMIAKENHTLIPKLYHDMDAKKWKIVQSNGLIYRAFKI